MPAQLRYTATHRGAHTGIDNEVDVDPLPLLPTPADDRDAKERARHRGCCNRSLAVELSQVAP